MSQPKYWWYGNIKRAIMQGGWRDPKSFQEFCLQKAIYEAEDETLKLPNGEDRLKAVKSILIDKVKNYDGVAIEIYSSAPTVQRWINSFVNLVGKKAGY